MKKRLLSLGLALVMLLSLLPTSVLATDYGYGATAPTQYAVGDTIVVLRWFNYDLPDGNKIPDDTQWVKIGESNCNNPAHWGKGWSSHDEECNWGFLQELGSTYGQFQLVSTATPEQPDPDQPDPEEPDDDTPGKVTASKTAVDNGNGTYTITLSVQGNKTTATTARDSDVVLLVDNSTSMTQKNSDRLTPAKNAAKQFVNTLLADGKNNRVAVYGFAGKDKNGGADDSGAFTVEKGLMAAANKDELLSAINGMKTDSNKNATNYTAALAKAKSILDDRIDKTRNGVVVFITDGAPSAPGSTNDRGNIKWNGLAEAAAIKAAKYTLYTIGINISGDDLTYLNSLASSGCNYNVKDSNLATQLTGILSDIAYQIREVAAGTSAVIEDVVNLDDYEFDLGTDGEPVIECSAGTSATVDKTTGKVTWTIGDIPDGTAATCEITVKANNTTALREQAADKHTNKSVKLSYYVGEDKVERTNLGDPHFELPANAAKYTVNHFKATADGTYPTTASETETLGPVLYGTEITPANVKKSYTGYAFDHADKAKLTVSSTAASNVINLYYKSNTYTVTYSAGTLTGVTGLPAPATVAYNGSHTVSNTVPTRAGYTFDGWTDVEGNTYDGDDVISNITNNITLYATWKEAYTLIYAPGMGSGTTVTETYATSPVSLAADNKGFTAPAAGEGHKAVVFVGWSETNYTKIFSNTDTVKPALITSVSFDAEHTSRTVYAVWSYDDIGNDPQKTPNDPDGKPDVFQAEVTYKVVNGKWSDDSTADKKVVFDLKTKNNGVWTDANPTPTLGTTIPTGMKPDTGYAAPGAWNTTISAETAVTADATYTYTFSLRSYKLIYNGNAQGTGSTVSNVPVDTSSYTSGQTASLEQGAVPTHSNVDGKAVIFVGWSKTQTSKIYDKGETSQLPELITSVKFDNADITVYAVWSYDEIGNDPQKTPNDPDGKPDVFQAEVTYKVVNGKWSDDSNADKKVVFDLKTKNNGVWTDVTPAHALGTTIPTGMKPDTGYAAPGAWNTTISAETAVTADATYTYTFTRIGTLVVDPEDPNGDNDKDDALVWKKLAVSGTGFKGETFTVTLYPVSEDDGPGQGPVDPRMIRSQFQVVSYTGKVTMTAAGTKSFSFTEDNRLTFTAPGNYRFKVVETKGSTKNMTYDETEYELFIQITMGQDGALSVAEYKTVTVENSYKGGSGVVVPADKVVQLEKGDHFNYVMGYSDGTIRPNNEITRGEVAIIFFRLLTKESRDYYYSESNDFTDVAATSKSNIAISTLTRAGILTGYSDGTFRPNAKVTRGQLAAIIARFADMKGDVDKTFTDIDGYWARDLILLAASNGWIDGYSDGTFRPANNITRAQTMAIINRALDRQVSHVEDLLDEEVMNVWVDNMDPEAWYYFHVQEATNYHSYVRKGVNSLDEKWTAKIEDIDWAVYQF